MGKVENFYSKYLMGVKKTTINSWKKEAEARQCKESLDFRVVHCNMLAFGFLDMYLKDGNKSNRNLDIIHKDLSEKLKEYENNFLSIDKEVMRAYDKFTKFVDENDTVVKALPFALRFIILNPSPPRRALKLALKEDKNFKFNRDPKVLEAKELVRKFLEV